MIYYDRKVNDDFLPFTLLEYEREKFISEQELLEFKRELYADRPY